MRRVYIDCNILLDWLLRREPYSFYATQLISLTEKKEIESYVSPLTLANAHYIIKKMLNEKVADQFTKDSLSLFRIADITADIVQKAISNKYHDFEDDLHYFTAVNNSIEFLITRNIKDFRQEKIKIMDAENFIKNTIK